MAGKAKKKGKGARFGGPEGARGAKGGKGKGGEEGPNAFEQLWHRRKFDVLGKKVKGEGQGQARRVSLGKARSDAVERRRGTLLQEFAARGTANEFVDRRFGEDDALIPHDERAIVRFQEGAAGGSRAEDSGYSV